MTPTDYTIPQLEELLATIIRSRDLYADMECNSAVLGHRLAERAAIAAAGRDIAHVKDHIAAVEAQYCDGGSAERFASKHTARIWQAYMGDEAASPIYPDTEFERRVNKEATPYDPAD